MKQLRIVGASCRLASGRPSIPQTWNRYSLVLNNPLRLVDPTGLRDEEVHKAAEGGEALPPQSTVLVKSATITVKSGTVKGEVGAFGVTFDLNEAQTAEVFGGDSFQVNVNLILPETVSSMTPTTEGPSSDRPLAQGKDKTTMSGSRVQVPEESNFAVGTGPPVLIPDGKANRRPAPGVTFSDLKSTPGGDLKTTTATFDLTARSDSVNRSNSVSLRLEGRSDRGQIIRVPTIQITIQPMKR